MTGLLTAVCGLDGSGKSTQIKLLERWFNDNNLACETTRQPTNYYREDERVRNYLDNGVCPDMKSIALLAADRRWHLATYIEPKIAENINIVSDRYLYSSLTYFKVRGLDENFIRIINGDIRKPDVIIFLDLKAEETVQRVKLRGNNELKYEERNIEVFKEIRKTFHDILPEDTIIIDATQSQEIIHSIIIDNVIKKMKEVKNLETT